MENLEDDVGEIINVTTTPDVEATPETAPSNLNENQDDSLEIIENIIEVLDLTSPQPSTTSCNSAGAVGASSLVKRNLEESLKKETNLDQTPSTSSAANTTNESSATNLLECPICLQTCIHPARLPCGHIFCFLCVKGVAYKNPRCAMCRREIPPEFLDHPQLVNGIEDICTTKATDDGYQWFYEGRNGGWWAYEKRNASEIEEAFHQMLLNTSDSEMKKEGNRSGNDEHDNGNDEDDDVSDNAGKEFDNKKKYILRPFTYDIQICGSMYTLDFKKMIQYPQQMPYRKRKICRAKGLPAKGVAGILNSKRKRRMKPY